MLQIAHFVLLFTVAVGLVAIYINYQLYGEYRVKYLLSYLYILIGFNVISFVHSFETFLKLTVNNSSSSIELALYDTIMPVALSCIRIFLAYHFLFFLWNIIEKKWSALYRNFCWGLLLVYLGANLLFFIKPVPLAFLPGITYTIVHITFFTIIGLSIIILLSYSTKIKHRGRKSAIILFSIFLFVFNSGLFITRLNLYQGWIDSNSQMTVISLIMLVFNTANMIYFKKFFAEIHINYLTPNTNSVNELTEKYRITYREKEIIVLTCKGKTNKEIAEELFLSPVTVRDHLSNVYRKTQTKNRVELVSLFKE